MLNQDYQFRPLMLGLEELDALMLGAQMVKSWGDDSIAQAASQAIDKLTSVLPDATRQEMEE